MMNKRIIVLTFFIPILVAVHVLFGKNEQSNSTLGIPRFEHVAFNVQDPVTVAQWYVQHLGMKVLRHGGEPTFTTFIADSGKRMMIEFFRNTSAPLFPAESCHVMSIHLAFSTPTLDSTVKRLLLAGARWADTIQVTPLGDRVCILRDPWGIPLQFVERKKPLLPHVGTYIEHIAFNVSDSRVQTTWYIQNLSMKVLREGSAPTYGMFVSDSSLSMMFELYQNSNYPLFRFPKVHTLSFHVAFSVPNVYQIKERLLSVGATLEDDITVTSAGDSILMVRDPWGLPLQFVKRAQPMVE